MPGKAGGVRGAVAVGIGVSAGTGVSVGWLFWLICATAVSKAAVSATFVSGVAAAGWHEARNAVNRLRLRKRCAVRNPFLFFMRRILIEKNRTFAEANVLFILFANKFTRRFCLK